MHTLYLPLWRIAIPHICEIRSTCSGSRLKDSLLRNIGVWKYLDISHSITSLGGNGGFFDDRGFPDNPSPVYLQRQLPDMNVFPNHNHIVCALALAIHIHIESVEIKPRSGCELDVRICVGYDPQFLEARGN